MNGSCLRPPNNQSMSDAIVRNAVHRSWASQDCCTPETRREESVGGSISQHSVQRQTRHRSFKELPSQEPVAASACEVLTNDVGCWRPPTTALLTAAQTHKNYHQCCDTRVTVAKGIALADAKTTSPSRDPVRERRRQNQQRYRKKQNKHMTDLAGAVRRLKDEIEDLDLQHHCISFGIPTQQTAWNVVAEYFRIFRCGLVSRALHRCALSFLQKTMSPDVTDGIVYGPESLLENWRLLSVHFDNIGVRLNRLVEVSADSVVAVMTTSITISSNTLRQVFPRLNSDGKGGVGKGEWSAVATKLLNRTLVLRGSVRFDWDNTCERVVGIYSHSDLLTLLLQLLGSLEDAACVLNGALVTPEFRIAPRSGM